MCLIWGTSLAVFSVLTYLPGTLAYPLKETLFDRILSLKTDQTCDFRTGELS